MNFNFLFYMNLTLSCLVGVASQASYSDYFVSCSDRYNAAQSAAQNNILKVSLKKQYYCEKLQYSDWGSVEDAARVDVQSMNENVGEDQEKLLSETLKVQYDLCLATGKNDRFNEFDLQSLPGQRAQYEWAAYRDCQEPAAEGQAVYALCSETVDKINSQFNLKLSLNADSEVVLSSETDTQAINSIRSFFNQFDQRDFYQNWKHSACRPFAGTSCQKRTWSFSEIKQTLESAVVEKIRGDRAEVVKTCGL